jgi:hypothetical protein
MTRFYQVMAAATTQLTKTKTKLMAAIEQVEHRWRHKITPSVKVITAL